VQTYEYVWAIATVIFSYTGSPQVKISQKCFRGLLFWLTLWMNLTTPNLESTSPISWPVVWERQPERTNYLKNPCTSAAATAAAKTVLVAILATNRQWSVVVSCGRSWSAPGNRWDRSTEQQAPFYCRSLAGKCHSAATHNLSVPTMMSCVSRPL